MKSKSFGNTIRIVAGIVIAVSLVVIFVSRPWEKRQVVKPAVKQDEGSQPSSNQQQTQESFRERLAAELKLGGNDFSEQGGVLRPKRDLPYAKQLAQTKPDQASNPLPFPGSSVRLRGDENPQVAGLFQELQQDDVPAAAKSALFLPAKFDLAAFTAAPQEYVKKIRPGRVFQSAQPGPGVVPLVPQGPTYAEVIQGEKVVLKVKAEPGMPVTYHTGQLGEFSNRLRTITVIADQDGIAQATYLAGRGTVDLINILAASPVHSEDVLFIVDVALPENN